MVPAGDGTVDGSANGRWQGGQHDLAALAGNAKDPVAVFLAEVADAGVAGFEDPQPEQPEHGHQGEVVDVGTQVVVLCSSRGPR